MKCKICKVEHGLDIFTTIDDGVIKDVGYLYGICFYCFDKVPSYIHKTQVKKWLFHEMQKL